VIAKVNIALGLTISFAFVFVGRAKAQQTWKLSIITEETTMFKNGMRPVHPGEILREDYLVPLGMTANALAKALNVPAARIHDIVRERRAVTADTAMRLARYFGGDARSWLNLQAAYDLRVAEIRNAKRIKREIAPAAA
jgi:addiction module HigA family antidote